MPPRSRDVFSFSLLFMPGISHRLSTVSVNNCLLQKTLSQWNLSKVVFSEMKAEDSETGCYFGLGSSAGPNYLSVPILCS